MKTLFTSLVCLLSICSLAQEKKYVKPPIQQLEKIKIVTTPVSGEPALISQMEGIEKQMASLQSRQEQLLRDLEALAKQQEEMKNKLDRVSEMTEEASMRLQMYMDRRQKALETLSNIMKKMSDTQSSIVQNLK